MNEKRGIIKFLCIALVVAICSFNCSTENPTGGGTDVGNPAVGTIRSVDGTPVANAEIIIRSFDSTKVPDTVYSNENGRFQFSSVEQGDYAIFAQKDSLLGITHVKFDSLYDSNIEIQLDEPGAITIRLESLEQDSFSILGARIAGTNYLFTPDSNGNLHLSNAPGGEMVIILYDNKGQTTLFKNLKTKGGCEAYIIVDANKPPEEWISGGCGVRDPLEKPYLTWVSPPPGAVGAVARVNRNNDYDMALQFSHSMNTRITGNAISVVSSDSLAGLKELRWQGSDVLYINFCHKAFAEQDLCQNSGAYKVGATYSVIIDSMAESVLGVKISEPETLSFTPEPFPRITTVTGFRFIAAGYYEVWDSLPEVITLGDSVSPSIAFQDGNKIILNTIGSAIDSTLNLAIHCYENDTIPLDPIYSSNLTNITIEFPQLLKSGTKYQIVIDTSLKFQGGLSIPKSQTIVWKTLRFTINNALLLGSYDYTSKVSLTTGSSSRFTSSYFQEMFPHLPFTTFYASTVLDSTSVSKNITIPGYFSSETLLVQGSKFGWKSSQWLRPAKNYQFTILPGLKSIAGDSIGDSLQYSILTDSLQLMQAGIFDLKNLFSSKGYSLPKQDSLYQISVGEFVYQSQYIDYRLKSYQTFVTFNVPIDSSIAVNKFSIHPDNGFFYRSNSTGMEWFANTWLIPDTLYRISLSPGITDTFSNQTSDTFAYQFQTEKFDLKIGNLFGVYFGTTQEEISQIVQLPGEQLPDIEIIPQNVEAGSLQVYSIGTDLYGNKGASFRIEGSIIANNAGISLSIIGIPLSSFAPGYDNKINFLSFSGIPDSNDYRNYVSVTPNDGNIVFKLEENKLRFSNTRQYQPNTNYVIKIDNGFHDSYGNALNDTISVSFTTPEFQLHSIRLGYNSFSRDSILKSVKIDSISTSSLFSQFWFTYPLQILSIDGNLTFEPEIPGKLEVISVNGLSGLSGVSFSANRPLIPDTTYLITIGNGIKEKNGNRLDTTYTLTFQTEKFMISSLRIGTQRDTSLFSIYTNSVLDTNSFEQSINIEPLKYSAGTYKMTNDSTGFNFIPDSTFSLGDEIKVKVDSTLMDIYGNKVQNPDSLSFAITYKEY